ncbi:Nuclear envelope morphology protein 1 [Ceratobasidium sp. 423]|nr:Nuclear envelope morphology protein 1 [Ceratobasidium sp. 423]
MSQPNKTLYIKNLNDQVKKDELKSQLYALFTPYGRIVDVVAVKSPKMRGQAFVVFQDLAGATAAMRAWDSELFYDKEMKIEYAKTRSYATRRIEEPGWDPLAEAKAKALGLGSRLKKEQRQGDGEAMDMDDEQSSNPNPQQNTSVPNTYSAVTISSRLLCTNIPPETTQEGLHKLFQNGDQAASMNTLGYISRQYDAIASTPSTPTPESVPLSSPFGQRRPSRTQDDSDIIRLGRLHSPSKRSKSQSLSPARSTALESAPDKPQRRRFILICFVIGIWNGLCALWSLLPIAWKRVRHNFGLITLRSDDDDEEEQQEEEEEDNPLVARAPPASAAPQRVSFENVLTKRTNRSSYAKPPTPGVSEKVLDDTPICTPPIPATQDAQNRPRAGSTLLPNPLSTSLLTPSASALPSRAPTPPMRRQTALHKTKTLVLDLDETLIHSTSRPMHAHGSMGGGGLLGLSGLFGGRRQGGGHMIEVVLGGRSTLYHVYKRPFVDFFLRKVSSWYTLVIFTASMPEYADPVIDWLDAGRGMFSRRFFRESCTHLPNGGYSKDLSIIDQDLSRVCLIDNSPASYSINSANGIPIEGWISDPGDEALLDLLPVLDSLRFTSDVRHVLGLRGY